MSESQKKSLLIAIVGPTGSGKSDLAIEMARTFGGEIVNCDSVQLYRYLNIGTAKVPLEERRGVPHHLIDILNPDETFTAGDYARAARDVLKEITARGRLPIVVGGTGFYLRALLQGLFSGPVRNDQLRARLSKRSPERLRRLLRRLDPQAAARIHENDVQKTVRALEVCLLARQPMTELHQRGRTPLDGYEVLKIGLDPPRRELAARIDARCIRMFENGLVEEVAGILSRGFPEQSKALEAIGYREALRHLKGEISLEEAVALTQNSTRQYAKRQRTWFRREEDIYWIKAFGADECAVTKAKELGAAPHENLASDTGVEGTPRYTEGV